MRVVNVKEEFSAGEEFRFYPISDTHLGAAECDEAELRKLVARIEKDPLARWGHGGDIGDLITPKDKRFQAGNVADRYRSKMHRIPDATIEHALDIFRPIAHQCWYIGAGNHESSLAHHYDRNVAAEIHAGLGLVDRYIGYRGFINVQFTDRVSATRRRSLTIDMHHGWQAGRLYGAFHLQAERELGYSNADIIVKGHSHKRQAVVFSSWAVAFGVDKPRPQSRIVVCTGTFMHSIKPASTSTAVISDVADDTYAERKGFRPQDPLGPPTITIKPLSGGGPNVTQARGGEGNAGAPRFDLSVSL